MQKIAIFFQSSPQPVIDGIKKPFKEGGYSDSGADIGFALKQSGVDVITPKKFPNPTVDSDWVFPDTDAGFQLAYNLGARIFWLNTVLHKAHPVVSLKFPDIKIIGQNPELVERFDDKFSTNQFLADNKLAVAKSFLITDIAGFKQSGLSYPFILKPVRGRGSQGVVVIKDQEQLQATLNQYLAGDLYGRAFIAEELLPGEEITITVMPAGTYQIDQQAKTIELPWALPPVRRFNHHDGVAPYNGVVAVSANSVVLNKLELSQVSVQSIMQDCAKAGRLVGALAPIRIDCRQDADRNYKIFDLNMKPNMTGPGRPGRDQQDSLCLMAAKAIGWNYPDFLKNIAKQAW